ncbi:MAG: alanine--tRNA ligase [Thermoplasmata archaeon]
MFEEEYVLEFFKERGFLRKRCSECGEHFWTLDREVDVCQDTPCVEFSFIGDSPFKKTLSVSDMREYFLSFFDKRDHKRVERYPVIARWRDDVFLVHASIYDFQPHATSGRVKPPSNPLAVSQPCIRLPDIDEVGKTGKHTTSFEMMGHHAFNSPDEYIYWKDETVRYCHQMLTDLGVDEKEIVYKEHPWIGGGNAGPSLEVNIRGLEVATLVFMNMKKDKNGEVELDGQMYSPLKLNVVDTGYGLERWVWMSDGAPTIYDSIYGEVIEFICEKLGVKHDTDDPSYRNFLEEYTRLSSKLGTDFNDKKLMNTLMERVDGFDKEYMMETLERLRSIYTIADHSKTIALMLSDGVVPSNVEEGYLARMVIRRTLRQLDSLEEELDLKDLIAKQFEVFQDILKKNEVVFDMIDSEIDRYRETMKRGKRLVKRDLEGMEKKLSLDKLIDYYDTHGIHPTVVKDLAQEYDIEVDIPDNFNTLLAEMHGEPEVEEGIEKEEVYPETKMLYYREQPVKKFEAEVVHVEGNKVVLDRSAFYPEGGGQLCDKGVLKHGDEILEVEFVEKKGGAVFHHINGKLKVGDRVKGEVDWGRRMALTRNHTATHLIISAARKVLGDHIWQKGAHKSVESARLDISHYKRISYEELKDMERLANEMVLEAIPVAKENLFRDEAEKRFGFELYQGGVPTSDVIRVVHISDEIDYDAQACGGTHVDNTSHIGAIKILNSQRIQDGVERLVYSAGISAVEHIQRQEELLRNTANVFSVNYQELPKTAKRFFEEWKERGKELDKLKSYRSMAVVDGLTPEEIDGVKFVMAEVDLDTKEMLAVAEKFTAEDNRVALLASKGEGIQLVFSRSEDIDINMVDVLREAAKEVNGGGGGTPRTAQGGGKKTEGRKQALKVAKNDVLKRLNGPAGI